MQQFIQLYGLKIGALLVAAIVLFQPKINFAWLLSLPAALFGRFWTRGSANSTQTVDAAARDVAEVEAFKLLKASAKRRNCKEAIAAMDAYGQHFFTDCSAEG